MPTLGSTPDFNATNFNATNFNAESSSRGRSEDPKVDYKSAGYIRANFDSPLELLKFKKMNAKEASDFLNSIKDKSKAYAVIRPSSQPGCPGTLSCKLPGQSVIHIRLDEPIMATASGSDLGDTIKETERNSNDSIRKFLRKNVPDLLLLVPSKHQGDGAGFNSEFPKDPKVDHKSSENIESKFNSSLDSLKFKKMDARGANLFLDSVKDTSKPYAVIRPSSQPGCPGTLSCKIPGEKGIIHIRLHEPIMGTGSSTSLGDAIDETKKHLGDRVRKILEKNIHDMKLFSPSETPGNVDGKTSPPPFSRFSESQGNSKRESVPPMFQRSGKPQNHSPVSGLSAGETRKNVEQKDKVAPEKVRLGQENIRTESSKIVQKISDDLLVKGLGGLKGSLTLSSIIDLDDNRFSQRELQGFKSKLQGLAKTSMAQKMPKSENGKFSNDGPLATEFKSRHYDDADIKLLLRVIEKGIKKDFSL